MRVYPSGGLDPALVLVDESEGWDAIAFDVGRNPLIRVTLDPGTYLVTAGSISGSGNFSLSVSVAPPMPQVTVGGSVTGYLSGGGSTQYELVLVTTRTLEFRLDATSGDLDPILVLTDESGDDVGGADDGGSGYNSYLRIELSPGTYTVTAACWPGTSGAFRLSVNVSAS